MKSNKYEVNVFLGFMTLFAPWLFAGEIKIVSPHDGLYPYQLVSNSKDGVSSDVSGVYAADEQGNYQLLLQGEVLKKGSNPGVLHQLELSLRTKRHEALLVVDGTLYLVQQSNEEAFNARDSIIEIGSKNFPIIDPLTKQIIDLPLIQNFEDVHIETKPDSTYGLVNSQILLVSIRDRSKKNRDGVIPGITFSMRVLPKKSGQPWTLNTDSRAFLIDHEFIAGESLKRYMGLNSTYGANYVKILSKRISTKFMNELDTSLSEGLKKWKRLLIRSLDYLELKSILEANDQAFIPYIVAETGDIKIDAPLSAERRLQNGIAIRSSYDPFKKSYIMELKSSQQGETAPWFRYDGKLSLFENPLGIHNEAIFESEIGGQPSMIALIQGSLIYFYHDPSAESHFRSIRLLEEQVTGKVIKKMEMFETQIPLGQNIYLNERLLFVALQFSDNSESTLFIKLKSEGIGLIPDQASIREYKSFVGAKELKVRLHKGNLYSKTSMLFDERGVLGAGSAQYAKLGSPNKPMINLRDPDYTFQNLEYGDSIELHEDLLVVNFSTDESEEYSSLVVLDENKKIFFEQSQVNLLSKRKANGEITPILMNQSISDPESNTKIGDVIVFALGDEKSDSFRLGVALMDRESHFIPWNMYGEYNGSLRSLEFHNIPANFEQLDRVVFLGPKGKRDGARILISLKPKEGVEFSGGLYLSNIDFIKEKSKAKKSISVKSLVKLSHEYFEGAELLKRILVGKEDEVMWIYSKETGLQDPNTRVRDLSNGADFLLSGQKGRSLKPKPFSLNSDDDFSSFDLSAFKSANLWKRLSAMDVKKQVVSNYQKSNKDDNFKEDETESGKKLIHNFEKSFVGFREQIEQFADPSKPAEHRVILVSDDDKSDVMRYLAELLERGNARNWRMWGYDHDYSFFMFDPERASQEIVIENLQHLRERAKADAGVLLIDALDTMKVKVPAIESEQSEDSVSFKLVVGDQSDSDVDPHLLYLLATEGQRVQLDQLGKTPLETRVRMLMVATLSEWNELRRSAHNEMQGAAEKFFKVDRSFYNLNWRVFPPSSPFAEERVKALESRPVTGLESRMLPSLISKLEDLSNPEKDAEHLVMIVPPTLKKFVRTTALSTWVHADIRDKKTFWSQHRSNLRVYEFDGSDTSIDSVVKELDAMDAGANGFRSLLLVDGEKLRYSFREDAKQQKQNAKYLIRDVGTAEDGSEVDQHYPSVMYLLATEGKFVQPAKLINRDSKKNTNSILIFATQQEWDEAIRSNSFERRFGIEGRFKTLQLQSPTIAEKVKILEEIFDSPSLRSLSLLVKLANVPNSENMEVTPTESRTKLFQYLCNRIDTLSEQYKKEPTESFIKVVESLRQSVFSDPEIRRSRVLDRKAVERVLSKVMGIALNLHILPANDPLSRLADEEKAAYQIQETGYSGSMELILKYIRTINSQTRASGGARVIPSSVILFGERGTGKTYLFKSLASMLKLKFYDVMATDSSTNSDADAFFLNFESIRSEGVAGSDEISNGLTAKEWVKHIQKFLLSPKGYRGFIFLDDVHKAVPKDRWEILSFINQLHDAPNGFITLRDEDNVLREIFVGNLNLQMSLNPPDPDMLHEKGAKAGSTENLIVSRLKDKDCPFDHSVLARWSTIVNLSNFSVEAKGPALRARMVNAAQQELNVGSQVVLTSTHTIRDISEAFSGADARQFIDTSASELFSVVRRDSQDENSRVKLLIPRRMLGQNLSGSKTNLGLIIPNAASDRVSDKISDYVANQMVAISLGSKLENNNLFLLTHLVDSSRIQLYEAIIHAATSDLSFVKNSQNLLGPFLHALTAHVSQENYINLSSIQIDPTDFGVVPGGAKYSSFNRFLDSLIKLNDRNPLDNKFFRSSMFGKKVYNEFTDHRVSRTNSRSRADVMTETSHRLSIVFRDYLASLYWTNSLQELQHPRIWLQHLNSKETLSSQISKDLMKVIITEYRQFVEDFSFDQLAENQFYHDSTKFPSPYDLSRLFFYALDRAIASQEWGKIVLRTVGLLELIASENELSQTPALQEFLFKAKQSIIHPSVHDRLMQLASISDAYREKQGERAKELNQGFLKDCQNFFVQD